jgi:hypothetical protein
MKTYEVEQAWEIWYGAKSYACLHILYKILLPKYVHVFMRICALCLTSWMFAQFTDVNDSLKNWNKLLLVLLTIIIIIIIIINHYELCSSKIDFPSPKPLVSLCLIQFPSCTFRNHFANCEDSIPYVCPWARCTFSPTGKSFVIFPIHSTVTFFDWWKTDNRWYFTRKPENC